MFTGGVVVQICRVIHRVDVLHIISRSVVVSRRDIIIEHDVDCSDTETQSRYDLILPEHVMVVVDSVVEN